MDVQYENHYKALIVINQFNDALTSILFVYLQRQHHGCSFWNMFEILINLLSDGPCASLNVATF